MHLSVGNYSSALEEYIGPTGKRSAVKVACSVWSRGKAVRPYLLLLYQQGCMNPSEELKQLAGLLSPENSDYLASLALNSLEGAGIQIPLSGANSLERTIGWIKNHFGRLCAEAGETGRQVLDALTDPERAHDLLVVAIAAQFLMERIPGLHMDLHGATALAILAVRVFRSEG